MDKAEYDHIIKIVFVGDSAVGKSSILLRFTEGQFDVNLAATIGVDFKVHLIENFKDKLKVNLTIWDTAGQEKFSSMTSSYYRGAHGIFLVYDVSNRESFTHITKWLTEIDTYATNTDVVKFLIGNKIDLDQRVVSEEEGKNFAAQNKLLFWECSSKDGIGIDSAFQTLINAVLDTPSLRDDTATDKTKGTAVLGDNSGNQQAGFRGSYCSC